MEFLWHALQIIQNICVIGLGVSLGLTLDRTKKNRLLKRVYFWKVSYKDPVPSRPGDILSVAIMADNPVLAMKVFRQEYPSYTITNIEGYNL